MLCQGVRGFAGGALTPSNLFACACVCLCVLYCGVGCREPRFSLLLLGHQFSLCERDGFFKVLLWWLRYHLVERQGLMGGRWVAQKGGG